MSPAPLASAILGFFATDGLPDLVKDVIDVLSPQMNATTEGCSRGSADDSSERVLPYGIEASRITEKILRNYG